MRNPASLAAPGAVLGAVLAFAVPAWADDVAGTYDVKFEPVSTNCEAPLNYPQHGSLKIELKGGDLQVDIERTPLMIGKYNSKPGSKAEKVSAKSPKPGHTPIQGMDGVFSVAGRITAEGMLSLVMVGEYQAGGKPLCTQSWNLAGLKSRGDKPPAGDKPAKAEKPKK